MSGELNLQTLMRTLTCVLDDDLYVFATCEDRQVPEGIPFRMKFEEAEGTTLILTRDVAEKFEVAYEFPCRMITLNVHSSLEAVGFIAVIASELAKHNMGVNPVSGFFHDHLFVPDGREQDALDVLAKLAQQAG